MVSEPPIRTVVRLSPGWCPVLLKWCQVGMAMLQVRTASEAVLCSCRLCRRCVVPAAGASGPPLEDHAQPCHDVRPVPPPMVTVVNC